MDDWKQMVQMGSVVCRMWILMMEGREDWKVGVTNLLYRDFPNCVVGRDGWCEEGRSSTPKQYLH
jgi:hypothetical protein